MKIKNTRWSHCRDAIDGLSLLPRIGMPHMSLPNGMDGLATLMTLSLAPPKLRSSSQDIEKNPFLIRPAVNLLISLPMLLERAPTSVASMLFKHMTLCIPTPVLHSLLMLNTTTPITQQACKKPKTLSPL